MPIEKSTARDSHPIHKAVVDPPRPPQPLHEKLICRMHQASDGRQTLISHPAFAQYPAARIGQTDLLAPARTGSGIGQALRLHALLKSLCQCAISPAAQQRTASDDTLSAWPTNSRALSSSFAHWDAATTTQKACCLRKSRGQPREDAWRSSLGQTCMQRCPTSSSNSPAVIGSGRFECGGGMISLHTQQSAFSSSARRRTASAGSRSLFRVGSGILMVLDASTLLRHHGSFLD